MEESFDRIRDYVAQVLDRQGSHGMDHVLRVVHLCEVIGHAENADREVLIPAALLHDIARPAEDRGGLPHEQEGARMAEAFLRSLRYDDETIQRITHAIRAHRYRTTETPATPEARILSDADKLDAMGTIGIARTFIRAGEHGGGIADALEHIREKLLNLEGLMYTKTAAAIAEQRHRDLCRFYEILRKDAGLPE